MNDFEGSLRKDRTQANIKLTKTKHTKLKRPNRTLIEDYFSFLFHRRRKTK